MPTKSFDNLDYETAICTVCGEEKHRTEFHVRRRTDEEIVYHSQCKSCMQEKQKKLKSDPEKKVQYDAANREGYLRRTYGITGEQYNQMMEKQNSSCAICNKHQKDSKKRLAVDHNHETGEIRGLLCDYCNHRVIGRHRNGDLLRKMADYVDQGTGWFVPKKKRPVKRKPKRK